MVRQASAERTRRNHIRAGTGRFSIRVGHFRQCIRCLLLFTYISRRHILCGTGTGFAAAVTFFGKSFLPGAAAGLGLSINRVCSCVILPGRDGGH